jgi:hypothetical protein
MGIGALSAMLVKDEQSPVASKKSQPPDGQNHHLQRNGKKTGAQRSEKQSSDQHSEAQYVDEIGKLQNESVNTFLNSHHRLLHYDALDTADVEEMRANEHTLELIGARVDNLDPPRKYKDQHEVFSAAVDQLHEAVQLAYALASDPTSATQSAFEEYKSHVEKATALLRRSNELLGRDYKRIEGVQKVGSSP